jgi:hypothetical protein
MPRVTRQWMYGCDLFFSFQFEDLRGRGAQTARSCVCVGRGWRGNHIGLPHLRYR